jgi:DNA-directed RNA polymerase specialized sigma24 family protein
VSDQTDNLEDFHFAQKCVDGNTSAILDLQRSYGPELIAFLTGVGATFDEASDVVDSLWTHILSDTPERKARLRAYRGGSSLRTWLKIVALRRFYDLKRHDQTNLETTLDGLPEGSRTPPGAVVEFHILDAALFQLMRTVLEFAFSRCSAEDYVLMQLKFYDGLLNEDLARIWHCAPPTISRLVAKACGDVARETKKQLKEIDPWLDLKWQDFVEMCRWARPGDFDLDATA